MVQRTEDLEVKPEKASGFEGEEYPVSGLGSESARFRRGHMRKISRQWDPRICRRFALTRNHLLLVGLQLSGVGPWECLRLVRTAELLDDVGEVRSVLRFM
jgi:hypothetical protein